VAYRGGPESGQRDWLAPAGGMGSRPLPALLRALGCQLRAFDGARGAAVVPAPGGVHPCDGEAGFPPRQRHRWLRVLQSRDPDACVRLRLDRCGRRLLGPGHPDLHPGKPGTQFADLHPRADHLLGRVHEQQLVGPGGYRHSPGVHLDLRLQLSGRRCR
ncbi:unnamed protein product, partial [Effrenium voratum]